MAAEKGGGGERLPKSRSRAGPCSHGPPARCPACAQAQVRRGLRSPVKPPLRAVGEVGHPSAGLASFRSVSLAGGPRGGQRGWTPGPGGAPARTQLEAGASGKFGDFGNPALAPSLPHSAPRAGGRAGREGGSAGRRRAEGHTGSRCVPPSGRRQKRLSGRRKVSSSGPAELQRPAAVAGPAAQPRDLVRKAARAPPSSLVRRAVGETVFTRTPHPHAPSVPLLEMVTPFRNWKINTSLASSMR